MNKGLLIPASLLIELRRAAGGHNTGTVGWGEPLC
jgi:hypothetical protein